MQLKQGYSMKTTIKDIPFELQHLEYISEFSKTLFPSLLQAGYYVNCVPDGSWVHSGEVPNAMWSGELSAKCAAVIYVWNKELCIICEIKPKHETDNSSEHPCSIVLKIPRVKFSRLDHCLLA